MIIEEMSFVRVNGTTRNLSEIVDKNQYRLENFYFRDLSNVHDFSGYSEASAQLANVSMIEFEKERDIDGHVRNNILRHAKGDALDELGARVGIYRYNGSFASDEIVLTLTDTASEQYTVFSGTEFSTNDNIIFEVTEDKDINIGDNEINLRVLCIEPGIVGNVLPGSITNIITDLGFEATVTNNVEFTNGTDREDDDTYRARIYDSPNNYRVATSAWFEAMARQVVPAAYYDNSTKTIVYKPYNDNSIEELEAWFNLKAHQTPLPLSFNEANPQVVIDEKTHIIKVLYDKKNSFDIIKNKIQTVISDYVNKELGIGGEFKPEYCSFLCETVDGVLKVELTGYNHILVDNLHYPTIKGIVVVKEW